MTRAEFLKNVLPFNILPDEVLLGVADLLHEVRYTKDTVIYQQEVTKMKGVDIIVEGTYESFFYDSSHARRMEEHHDAGFCYGGVSVLLNRKRSLRTVVAKKGTVVYFLPRKDFRALCTAYEEFFHHFTADFGRRMLNEEFAHFAKKPTSFEESYLASEQLYSRRIESIGYRDIVYCDADTPIYQAASIMAENKTSCLIVRNAESEVLGFVTDITLRDKVIAARGNYDAPVIEVADNPVTTISSQAFVYEAVLMMFSTKTKYLLVEDQGVYKGIISRNRLLSEQAQSPLVYVQSVKLAVSVEELRSKWQQVPQMITQLLGRGVNAEIINQIISTIADTIAQKVIEEVIKRVGEPPAKFVFMVLGSEGRKEQTLKTDQDNAIIYEDKANEQRELVREYFLNFAKIVSEKLDYIGFSYCTGGFMASNPAWTHSLSHWKRNYVSWMEESLPETVIKFSTFFDCRYIYGDKNIIAELHQFLDEKLHEPMEKLFFHMANNAVQYQPPLTFFKNIRTITVGEQEVFDIKKAMTPIVDLVRLYCLKNRIFKTNTGERLKALKDIKVFSESEYHELNQSYYYLMAMRLKKQASQIIHDKAVPENYIDPNSLTKIEQVTLKEIFRTIETFQSRLRREYTNNLFG